MCASPGVNSARHTSPSIRKFSFKPIGLDGPQTKHRLAGDSIGEFILARSSEKSGYHDGFSKEYKA
jgi:hypothetical protein